METSYTLGTFRTTPEMRRLVDQVLDSGRLSYGPLCREFEEQFAERHDCEFGVLSNSGTSSLQVALQAMKELYGWADGMEVIVPALTFVATINIVLHCRLTPVLVDVEPTHYSIDPLLIREKITTRTRAIIPVHPFGQGADMEAIMSIAQNAGLKVIEDSCEAMFVGMGTPRKRVGSWGHVGCFSTYVAHIITGGVGGISITNDPDLAMKMRSLVNHGIEMGSLPSGSIYDPSFLGRNFRFSSIGHSFRITELEAALLLPQLAMGEDIVRTRKAVATALTANLFDLENAMHVQLPFARKEYEHAFMVYPIMQHFDDKRPIMRYLREHRVECRDMLPLTNQPCYDFNPAHYPVSQTINDRGFYIGCHQDITKSQMEHVVTVLYDWYNKLNKPKE